VLRPHLFTTWVRLSLLILVGVLAVLAARSPAPLTWWLAIAAAALPGLLAEDRPVLSRIGRIAEIVIASVAAASATGAVGAVLPYLAVPIFAAALFAGAMESMALVVLAAATVTMASVVTGTMDDSMFTLASFQWVVVSALAGLIGARVRQIMRSRPPASEPEYVQATRLLTQLRTIARQLPGTLDPRGIAERLLDELRDVVPAERGAVFTGSGGGRLEVLAQNGPDRVDWETSLSADTPIAEAWASQRPQTAARSLARTARGDEVSTLVLPLVTGVRTVGLVVLEADRAGAYPQATVVAATDLTGHAALRLETALLFDDVRSLATSEERQRLAREIHDGVAQELVMVGYGIDNAIAELPAGSEVAGSGLHALRAEVTRVITELRLSLFELRSDVDRHGGLASAIADYARTVGSSAGLRVHLSLDESTARLPASVESELLRIAQEAVTNARKHASAANLWVSCEIDPPFARIEIADDGRGIGDAAGEGSYGMSIMAERAERIRADLTIAARAPEGTTVRVVLGSRVGRGTVTQRQEVPPDRVQ
jgi:signal transduction histidine kinase